MKSHRWVGLAAIVLMAGALLAMIGFADAFKVAAIRTVKLKVFRHSTVSLTDAEADRILKAMSPFCRPIRR
jgi:hypothetical protein